MPLSRTAAKTNLKQLLAELVAMPTVSSDQAASHKAMEWVRRQVAGLPLRIYESESGGYPALVLTTQKTHQPKVLLMAHMDVVPAPVPAFKLVEKAGLWRGRGVFDMKLAIAIYIKLLHELGDDLPHYDLGVMLTSDEEISGTHGVARLVEEGWLADVVVNLDASSHWELEVAAKGNNWFRVESVGVAGHGSRPWAHKSAIVTLMDFLTDLGKQFPAEPCADSQHRHNTLNVGTISGGTARNQIAGQAEATLDVRTMPDVKPADIAFLLKQAAGRHPGITVIPTEGGMSLQMDPENEYLRLAEHIITKVVGVKPKLVLSHGASDSRYMVAKGVPCIMTRPPGGGAHGDDEWVSAKGVEQLYKAVRDFTTQVAKLP